ncbi:MAG: rod shape-determining protein RodA [Thermonemataceae bacterium]
MSRRSIVANLDAVTIFLYLALVTLGILSIYSAVYDVKAPQPIYNLSIYSGKQILRLAFAVILVIGIMLIDYKLFEAFAYVFYALIVLLLVLVLIVGVKIGGARSWFDLGFMRLQPAEFAKLACSLAIAKYLSQSGVSLKIQRKNVGAFFKTALIALTILAVPALLILLQPDAGSMLIFVSFLLVFYREGLHSIFLFLPLDAGIFFVLALVVPIAYLSFAVLVLAALFFGIYYFLRGKITRRLVMSIILIALVHIAYAFSVNFIFENVLKPHQKERIMILLDEEVDKRARGSRYNLQQSKIAIGSGGLTGKGFLQGTQTKYDFVPEQRTDFIFCTIGEEGGWIGSSLLILLYIGLMSRVIIIAERQPDGFARIYGYGVASILFFHFTLNISMTMGLFPVVGIPLPFISYGGSSLWSFTILIFILLKLDAHRNRLFAG